MRIGHNLLYLIPGIVGGTETYGWSTLEALRSLDTENEYVSFINENTAAQPDLFPAGFRIVPLSVDARSRVKRYATEQLVLPHVVKRVKVDVLHSLGYVSVLRTDVPTVVTIHDVNFRHVPMPFSKRLTLGWFVRQSALRAHAIITVSEFSKKEICSEFGIDPNKVWVTYNAPNADVFVDPSEAANYGQTSSPPYILVLSSPSPHKNIDGLIRAFAEIAQLHPELRLVIAGHLAPNIRIPSRLQDRVEIMGYVSRDELLALYRSAACFVMPSFYEGFGIPIIEAMASGTPVAASNIAALPEVGGNAVCYFDPNNTEEMVHAILRLLEDSEFRTELVTRGRLRARMFTWEKSAQTLLDVYQLVGK